MNYQNFCFKPLLHGLGFSLEQGQGSAVPPRSHHLLAQSFPNYPTYLQRCTCPSPSQTGANPGPCGVRLRDAPAVLQLRLASALP